MYLSNEFEDFIIYNINISKRRKTKSIQKISCNMYLKIRKKANINRCDN